MRDRTFETLARLGFAARGAVYILVGGMAVLAALGRGGATTDSKGALVTVLSQPLGNVILICIAAGLLFFSAWRFAQAFLNADHLGATWKDRLRRVGFAFGGMVNAGLALSAVGLVIGLNRASSGEQNARDWTAWLLSLPFGQWVVGAVGAVLIGVGVGIGLRAFKRDFEDKLDVAPDVEKWVTPLGQAGFYARAAVFVVAGCFLLIAAWNTNPDEAKGLAGTLKSVQEQPYGWVLFGAIAAGLFLFGVFQFVLARYRRIDIPPAPTKSAARTSDVQYR